MIPLAMDVQILEQKLIVKQIHQVMLVFGIIKHQPASNSINVRIIHSQLQRMLQGMWLPKHLSNYRVKLQFALQLIVYVTQMELPAYHLSRVQLC